MSDTTRDCVTHHYACDCREAAHAAEVARLTAERDRLRDGIRGLRTVAAAFGVEHTSWRKEGVSGSQSGLAIPSDCDTCEVTVDSDVYEAMTDLFALLDR